MSSTIAVIAASSSASSSAALAASAHAERIARCGISIPNFEPKTATVAEMRDYASCVYVVHGSGEPMPAGVEIALKVLILGSLVGGLFFGAKSWREDGPVLGVLAFAMGALAIPIALLVVAAVVAGLAWIVM